MVTKLIVAVGVAVILYLPWVAATPGQSFSPATATPTATPLVRPPVVG